MVSNIGLVPIPVVLTRPVCEYAIELDTLGERLYIVFLGHHKFDLILDYFTVLTPCAYLGGLKVIGAYSSEGATDKLRFSDDRLPRVSHPTSNSTYLS